MKRKHNLSRVQYRSFLSNPYNNIKSYDNNNCINMYLYNFSPLATQMTLFKNLLKLKKTPNCQENTGGVIIRFNNFSDNRCHRLFLARFFVIFRVMGAIGVIGAPKLGGDGSYSDKWCTFLLVKIDFFTFLQNY